MYLKRDYVNLVDAGKDYLDKPHLLFWLCAASYKIFGVTTFAYKFPSFCFTLIGTYSTYRLGKNLYNADIGKLAALLIASAFAYILANNDVRMDAILTACVALSTWQGVEFIQRKRMLNAIGLSLGLALGFCTKGHIALFTPAVGLLFYLVYLRNWDFILPMRVLGWKWLIIVIVFVAMIMPVVYCYYQQFNLHPEKVVRGRDHINGVKFILFGQTVERLKGDAFGGDARHDYLFFFHSFLWAFAPWSVLAFIALFKRIKNFATRREEWLTPGTVIAIAVVITISGFKLPHYLNIIFPAAAIMTAALIATSSLNPKLIYFVQLTICAVMLVLLAVITSLAFPIKSLLIVVSLVALLTVVFYFFLTNRFSVVQKAISISTSAMVVSFFVLNANFYPQLLKYQAGNGLAKKIKGNVDPANIYFWGDTYSSSFNFYTATERKQFNDSLFDKGKKPLWLLFDKRDSAEISLAGYKIGLTYRAVDFEITKLDVKFMNPATRNKHLTQLAVGEIIERH